MRMYKMFFLSPKPAKNETKTGESERGALKNWSIIYFLSILFWGLGLNVKRKKKMNEFSLIFLCPNNTVWWAVEGDVVESRWGGDEHMCVSWWWWGQVTCDRCGRGGGTRKHDHAKKSRENSVHCPNKPRKKWEHAENRKCGKTTCSFLLKLEQQAFPHLGSG